MSGPAILGIYFLTSLSSVIAHCVGAALAGRRECPRCEKRVDV